MERALAARLNSAGRNGADHSSLDVRPRRARERRHKHVPGDHYGATTHPARADPKPTRIKSLAMDGMIGFSAFPAGWNARECDRLTPSPIPYIAGRSFDECGKVQPHHIELNGGLSVVTSGDLHGLPSFHALCSSLFGTAAST